MFGSFAFYSITHFPFLLKAWKWNLMYLVFSLMYLVYCCWHLEYKNVYQFSMSTSIMAIFNLHYECRSESIHSNK